MTPKNLLLLILAVLISTSPAGDVPSARAETPEHEVPTADAPLERAESVFSVPLTTSLRDLGAVVDTATTKAIFDRAIEGKKGTRTQLRAKRAGASKVYTSGGSLMVAIPLDLDLHASFKRCKKVRLGLKKKRLCANASDRSRGSITPRLRFGLSVGDDWGIPRLRFEGVEMGVAPALKVGPIRVTLPKGLHAALSRQGEALALTLGPQLSAIDLRSPLRALWGRGHGKIPIQGTALALFVEPTRLALSDLELSATQARLTVQVHAFTSVQPLDAALTPTPLPKNAPLAHRATPGFTIRTRVDVPFENLEAEATRHLVGRRYASPDAAQAATITAVEVRGRGDDELLVDVGFTTADGAEGVLSLSGRPDIADAGEGSELVIHGFQFDVETDQLLTTMGLRWMLNSALVTDATGALRAPIPTEQLRQAINQSLATRSPEALGVQVRGALDGLEFEAIRVDAEGVEVDALLTGRATLTPRAQ